MPAYRRYFVPGGTYFFTVVTAGRFPLFSDAWARHFLGQVMREVRDEMPFETVAIVLLPDHLHALWTLEGLGALTDPVIAERMRAVAAEPFPSTPAAFGTFIRSEIDKWGRIVKESGATSD